MNYHPNMVDDEDVRKNGLVCFLNNDRPCGPDCMAFAEPPEGADYQGKQWANCMILVNAHRVGKHLPILCSLGNELVKKAKNEAADRARANQPPPPVVR